MRKIVGIEYLLTGQRRVCVKSLAR